MSVASHWMNSRADVPGEGTGGREAKIVSAAVRFRPTIMMLPFPFVRRAKLSTIAWPIPEVPPTKTATGGYDEWKAALEARTKEREGIVMVLLEGGVLVSISFLFFYFRMMTNLDGFEGERVLSTCRSRITTPSDGSYPLRKAWGTLGL